MEDEIIDASKIPKLMISPTSPFKLIWNLVMLVIIVFIAVIVPYRISFENETSLEWIMIDTIIDGIFLIDITLNFLTAYEDESGVLIVDRR